jgi:hypothetical protein
MRLTALIVAAVAALASACGSPPAQGEELGAAFADLERLADEVQVDAVECAHEAGEVDAYIDEQGGIVHDGDAVFDCFDELLATPKYAVFSDDSPAMRRSIYDGFVAIHQCLEREGYASPEPPPFEDWVKAGRTWDPYGDMVAARDVDRLETATQKCQPR